MKERPILFNAEMVRAVLDGLKTQTRMLMDPQPPSFHWWAESPAEMRLASRYYPSANGERGCPLGAVGHRLWVQEAVDMPRRASHIDLLVTDVRIEQVQDISAIDAMWEGIVKAHNPVNRMTIEALGNGSSTGLAVIDDFALLWDSINANRGYSWDSNPWVWIVDFERVTP